MNNIRLHTLLFLVTILLGYNTSFAQALTTVSVENQAVIGTDLYFDVYLRTTAGSSDDLYLGDSDFLFNFNHGNFTSPTLTKVPNPSPIAPFAQNGYCTFTSRTYTSIIDLSTAAVVQKGYYDKTSTTISDNKLIISVSSPTPSDGTAFNEMLAKIDGTLLTHRLGRFKVSGISNPTGTAGLAWIGCVAGSSTELHTMVDSAPFLQTKIACGDLTTINSINLLLPVELSNFEVKKLGRNQSKLNWVTASEMNVDYFTIQRSQNGEDWKKLGQVAAKGNSTTSQAYEFIDAHPISGINYYRLRIVDEDGVFENSEIVALRFSEEGSHSTINLFPNPVSNTLTIDYSKIESTISFVRILDVNGQVIKERNVETNTNQQLLINVHDLSAGIYFVSLIGQEAIISQKFVKR